MPSNPVRRPRLSVSLITFFATVPIVAPRAQDGTSSASASRSRALAAMGQFPAPDEIRVEHFVNWHRHGLAMPRAGESVALELRLGSSRIGELGVVQVGLATAHAHDLAQLPAADLALVVDCSGSMAAAGKLERVREAILRFVERLRPADRVALIAFDDTARTVLPLAGSGDRARLREAVASLTSGGSTNLCAGVELGLRELGWAGDERTARIILFTDGMANVGITDPEAIVRISKEHQGRSGRGIDVSTIGCGADIDRALLARLAEGGHGLAHFIGDDEDIAKVFLREAQSLFAPVARDVELTLEWPAGLELEQVYGYAPRCEGGRLHVRLDDLNVGTTQVVLASVRRRTSEGAGAELPIRASLSFFDIAHGARRTLDATASFVPAVDADPVVDGEVGKNLTIAALATSLRTMAERHSGHDDDGAARVLRDALAMADRRFPRREDQDVERVRAQCARWLAVLVPDAAPSSADAWGPLRTKR